MEKTGITVLIVDENSRRAERVGEMLEGLCPKVYYAGSAEDTAAMLSRRKLDLVLTDILAGNDIDGFELLKAITRKYPDTQVVMLAQSPSIEACKKALRLGALDFLERPVSRGTLEEIIESLGRSFSLGSHSDVSTLQKRAGGELIFEGIHSKSPAMKNVIKVLRKASPTDLSILIEGESGTGKELTARAVHLNSRRAANEFRPINCAGLSETLLESELFGHVKGAFTGATADRKGLFEVADKGTLFLDEIGDMPLSMQAKLLRVLEDGVIVPLGSTKQVKVDVRLVSATNCDLAGLVEEKKFRQDLYFRIKGVGIVLPPLRSRREDIPVLIHHYLDLTCREIGVPMKDISRQCMEVLMAYFWPGNIRQLRNTVRAMVVMSDGEMIELSDIPNDINALPQLTAGPQPEASLGGQPLAELERQAILETLELTGGNREKAAKILGIGERTLYRKIKEYGVD
ncbi:MAG: sigma-54-dependent transcriptional regulator [Phycisphaerae bacterium]|jgi:two-component system response regulator HydG